MANNSNLDDNSGLPALSPALLSSYSSLPSINQRLFIKVFKYLWGVVLPARRFVGPAGPLLSFWGVDMLRSRAGLTSTELSLLTYIYMITKHNSKYIHSDLIYNSVILPGLVLSSKRHRLVDLHSAGYIVRRTSDPAALHLRRSHSRAPVFIKLSVKGVQVIESMEKNLYKLLLNTSLNDLTGVKAKK